MSCRCISLENVDVGRELMASLLLGGHVSHQVTDTVTVAKLIVIPEEERKVELNVHN